MSNVVVYRIRRAEITTYIGRYRHRLVRAWRNGFRIREKRIMLDIDVLRGQGGHQHDPLRAGLPCVDVGSARSAAGIGRIRYRSSEVLVLLQGGSIGGRIWPSISQQPASSCGAGCLRPRAARPETDVLHHVAVEDARRLRLDDLQQRRAVRRHRDTLRAAVSRIGSGGRYSHWPRVDRAVRRARPCRYRATERARFASCRRSRVAIDWREPTIGNA